MQFVRVWWVRIFRIQLWIFPIEGWCWCVCFFIYFYRLLVNGYNSCTHPLYHSFEGRGCTTGLYPVLYPLVLHVSTVACAIYVHCSSVAPGAHSTAPSVSNASGGSNRLMALCCSCLSFRAHLASICSCVFGALQMCLYDKFRSCEILPQFGHGTRTFNASLGLVKSTIY